MNPVNLKDYLNRVGPYSDAWSMYTATWNETKYDSGL